MPTISRTYAARPLLGLKLKVTVEGEQESIYMNHTKVILIMCQNTYHPLSAVLKKINNLSHGMG